MLPNALLLAATNNLDWVSVANVSCGPGPILAVLSKHIISYSARKRGLTRMVA